MISAFRAAFASSGASSAAADKATLWAWRRMLLGAIALCLLASGSAADCTLDPACLPPHPATRHLDAGVLADLLSDPICGPQLGLANATDFLRLELDQFAPNCAGVRRELSTDFSSIVSTAYQSTPTAADLEHLLSLAFLELLGNTETISCYKVFKYLRLQNAALDDVLSKPTPLPYTNSDFSVFSPYFVRARDLVAETSFGITDAELKAAENSSLLLTLLFDATISTGAVVDIESRLLDLEAESGFFSQTPAVLTSPISIFANDGDFKVGDLDLLPNGFKSSSMSQYNLYWRVLNLKKTISFAISAQQLLCSVPLHFKPYSSVKKATLYNLRRTLIKNNGIDNLKIPHVEKHTKIDHVDEKLYILENRINKIYAKVKNPDWTKNVLDTIIQDTTLTVKKAKRPTERDSVAFKLNEKRYHVLNARSEALLQIIMAK